MAGVPNLTLSYGQKKPLMDVYPAKFAVSLQKLRTGQTNAIRQRRTSNNTESDIGFSSNAFDATSALAFVNATNYLFQSEDFSSSAWTKLVGTVTTDATTAPDGTTTADQLTDATAINIYQIPSTSSGAKYVFSCYLKKSGSVNNCDLYMYDIGNGFLSQTTFNLNSGTIVSSPYGSGATITSVGSGWYRCTVEATTTGISDTSFGIYNTTEVYAWGAQVNPTTLTSYLKTTSSTYTGTYDGEIVTWYDQSGNSYDVTQATTTKQPQLINAGSMNTDGTDYAITFTRANADVLTRSVFATNTVFTAFIVLQLSAAADNYVPFLNGTATGYGLYTQGGVWKVFSRGVGDNGAGAYSTNTVLLTLCWKNSSDLTIRINGSNTYTGVGSATVTPSGTFYLGGGDFGDFFGGDMLEFILYDTDQSANFPAIESNIMSRYANI